MRVFALWFGGSSYAVPTVDQDLEEFSSIKQAKRTFYARYDGDPYYPCVDSNCEMHLFADRPNPSDPYPDWVLKLGPRGGVIQESV